MKPHGRRVFEPLATVTTLALVEVAVSVQVVLLEVNSQFEPDVTLLTPVRTLIPVHRQM